MEGIEGTINKKLSEKNDVIWESVLNLEKSMSVLNHLIREYDCCERLSVSEAAKWQTNGPVDDLNSVGYHSAKWVHDHKAIMTFINIVDDYIHLTKAELEKSMRNEEHNEHNEHNEHEDSDPEYLNGIADTKQNLTDEELKLIVRFAETLTRKNK